ncbi:MAG TPA: arginase family protein, partial [Candidatus Limnocylindria bacterium]|nr:arginase family protein [Candidatus Limnocylindria bacterium]
MSPETFLGVPSVEIGALSGGELEAVILGVPHGVPYPTPGQAAGCADAPAAVRERSRRMGRFAEHHDFDLDGPMLPDGAGFRIVDGGDVPGTPEDGAGNSTRAESAVRAVLAAGAVPIVIGGDDSV